MIKKLFFITAITVILASCNGGAGLNENKNAEGSAPEAVQSETPEIILAEFDAKAGEYVDEEVIVAGLVDHVCKHGGKKLFLVSDDGDIHVESDERFDEELTGSKIIVTGLVREFRVDEAYCLKMEEDNIKSHSEGETDEDLYTQKMEQIQWYRDSMTTANSDHLSFYSLEYLSHVVTDTEMEDDHDHEDGHDHDGEQDS